MVEKKGGCIQKGCVTLVLIFIIFLVIGFISSLFPDTEDTSTNSQGKTTRTTTQTVTPENEEEELVKPQPQAEEPAEPKPEEATVKPQQQEDTPTEPSSTENESLTLANTIEEAPKSTKIITRNYEWAYDGSDWNWKISISEAMYEYFKGVPRPPTRNFSIYVTHPWDDPYIDRLVENIKEAAAEKGYDEFQTVKFIIAFVQSLPYTVDSETSPFDEYPRYPIETLTDEGGDCEDTSILLASLLHEMGYGVILLRLPGHMAVGIKGGDNIFGTYWTLGEDKYFYIETTATGRQIGELPEIYEGKSAEILTLKPVPIITHEWSLEGEGNYAVLKVKVNNLGTATASDVYVYAGFDAGDGTGWSLKKSDTFDLEPGHQVTATLGLLPPPRGVRARLLVRIVMGGYKVDESYSAWVDT